MLAASVLFVACSGTGTDGADAAQVRPLPELCETITPADAERALGGPIVTSTPVVDDDSVTCGYRPVGALDETIELTASVRRYDDVPAAEDAFSEQSSGDAVRNVPGLGDAAAVVGATKPDVVERSGNLVFRFSLGSVDDAGRPDRLLQLARDVVGRI